ncbi:MULTISPECIES: hypothetical protein [unclassified Streptomyces]|uniref:baeRF2 domain-containing protein n=1 Tax=unclassified Streptomyces TaxID=2593676 RepID=UPI0006B02C9A|nr:MULTISPECIES: hypothetical protein [unclassified Streptomyces]KOX37468.1 hypothetical protein ADL06_02850 [Streptomyces sp. NRRL F-6491]KOX52056.1 hypothetical protein ADL08_02800 [Streptomyces sp. NRRL F-6492]
MNLDFLKPLLERPGPWASVYVETDRSTEDAARIQRLRNRSVAARLVDDGADPATIRAVAERLGAEPVSGSPPGRALFATDGEVVLDVPLRATPPSADVTWTNLPHIAPLVLLRGDEPACQVALIDREGADLELRDSRGTRSLGEARGKPWQGRGHRSLPQDRYEWHYSNKVEDAWEETADIIAGELVRRCPQDGDTLLVLAGDARERKAVRERLPQRLRSVAVEVDHGSRAPGASTALLDRQIEEARSRYAQERVRSALDDFRRARGRPGEHRETTVDTGRGPAAEGIPAVAAAAREHQVATLLLGRDAPDASRPVWVGAGPDEIAAGRAEAKGWGIGRPEEARADDALLRACVAAGSEVLVVPEEMAGPAGGLGAVLRWND